MIPLRLQVRNFMCYRDDVPPLDFGGIHVACLTGANGHGKSALLDAVTWALWGKARAKRDDELIHLGESEMEVDYTFDLGGTVYRVVRKRDSTGRGRSLLDFQVGHDSSFQSIAGSTIRETQAAINRLLRMEYETFTNSAFLLQGKADAFTTRTPAERKRVLGEVLGLSLYDEYEQRAKEMARDKERQLAELEGLLRDIDRELARQPEYEAELAQIRARVTQLSAEVTEAGLALQTLRHEQQMLEHQHTQLDQLEKRVGRLERELGELQAQAVERQQRIGEYEAVLAKRAEVEEGHAQLVEARTAEAAWNERLAKHAELQERRGEVERVVAAARHELELGVSRLAGRARDLQKDAAELPEHERRLAEVRETLEHLAERQRDRDAGQSQLQLLAQEEAGLEVQNDQLYAQMKVLEQRIELLKREADEAQCPLCRQTLSEEHRNQVLRQFQAEGEELADAHRANTARRHEIASERRELEARMRRLDQELAKQPAQQRLEAQLEQAAARAREASTSLEAAHAELTALESRLEAADFAAAEQAELARLAAEAEVVDYNRTAHQQAVALAAELAHFETANQRLQAALERVDEERATLKDLQARQARWEEDLANDRAQSQGLAEGVARLPEVTTLVAEKAGELEGLQAEASRARLALGAAQQKLDHCQHLAQERIRHEASRKQRAEEKAIFEELRLAFGKRGIQAMIIEAAIPEIEYEANQLLARMTDGRMHVRFETQRETLKGDTLETLDINIADELGTRPYELFSGGEAFRVNFAIRIALSKLLARRAGAQLHMLVIDEGFGTQDAEGRERLVEAINSIQDEFARILVITHIEELKDAFPVRIEVTKTAEGSQIRLN